MWDDAPMRTTVLTCPKCGASLALPHAERRVQCTYCKTSVVVEGDRGEPRGALPDRSVSSPVPILFALVAVFFVGASAVVLLRSDPQSPPVPPPPEPTPVAAPDTP